MFSPTLGWRVDGERGVIWSVYLASWPLKGILSGAYLYLISYRVLNYRQSSIPWDRKKKKKWGEGAHTQSVRLEEQNRGFPPILHYHDYPMIILNYLKSPCLSQPKKHRVFEWILINKTHLYAVNKRLTLALRTYIGKK